MRLTAQRFEPLDKVARQAAAGLKVVLGEGEALAPLKAMMARRGRRPRPGERGGAA